MYECHRLDPSHACITEFTIRSHCFFSFLRFPFCFRNVCIIVSFPLCAIDMFDSPDTRKSNFRKRNVWWVQAVLCIIRLIYQCFAGSLHYLSIENYGTLLPVSLSTYLWSWSASWGRLCCCHSLLVLEGSCCKSIGLSTACWSLIWQHRKSTPDICNHTSGRTWQVYERCHLHNL